MTKKEFMNCVGNGREDILQQMRDLLNETKVDYCVIGGLAVNAYVEPVVSLGLDLVVVTEATESCKRLISCKLKRVTLFLANVLYRNEQSVFTDLYRLHNHCYVAISF